MSEKLIQAGSSVESQCRKCKTVTDHHVVVMDGETIVKVECKVCKSRHAFKTPAEPKVKAQSVLRPKKEASAGQSSAVRAASATTRQTAAATKQAQAMAEQWEKLVAPCASPATYSMERVYRAGDVIDHPSFGLGYVQRVMKPRTMEVRFKDSIRNMRCAPIA